MRPYECAQVNQTKCVLLHTLVCSVDVIFTYFNGVYSLVVPFNMKTPSSNIISLHQIYFFIINVYIGTIRSVLGKSNNKNSDNKEKSSIISSHGTLCFYTSFIAIISMKNIIKFLRCARGNKSNNHRMEGIAEPNGMVLRCK